MANGKRSDPSPSFRFKVEIEDVTVAHFSECGGLEMESEPFDYKEGGLNSRVHRLPGRFKFSNLTLKKGIAEDGEALWKWVKDTVSGQILSRRVTVTLFDLTGTKPLREWVFEGAYPMKWGASALNAEQNVIAVETLTLAHQGMNFAQ